MNQVLVVNKSINLTSRDVVNKLNSIFKTKKIGHTGTLDPMATGVLVCVFGKYTKLVDYLSQTDKEYLASIKLGIETDTLDITGNIIKEEKVKKFSVKEINDVLQSFVGIYKQQIPLYSAKHVNGKRLYEYARLKESVTLPENEVEIRKIEFISYKNAEITFKVLVSKGTYIRSLIQSICQKLEVIGTMNHLVRTKQGNFDLAHSYTLEEIGKNNYEALKIRDILDVKEIKLTEEISKKVRNGNKLNLDLDGYVLFTENEKEVALYDFKNNLGKLIILINEE